MGTLLMGCSKGISTLVLPTASGPERKTYEYTVLGLLLAEVEEQYLPAVPLPVHHMQFFNNSAAELDRELLRLPI